MCKLRSAKALSFSFLIQIKEVIGHSARSHSMPDYDTFTESVKHLHHVCGYCDIAILMRVVKKHFPEIYSKNKSINWHFEEVKDYLNKSGGWR